MNGNNSLRVVNMNIITPELLTGMLKTHHELLLFMLRTHDELLT